MLKSQIIGILLASATAFGCIFYERLVSVLQYQTMVLIYLIEMILVMTVSLFIWDYKIAEDIVKFQNDPKLIYYVIGYILTAVTSMCWYYITKNQGVMTSSIYEVKYIIILTLIYILFGKQQFTINTLIGICLALGSIYFISK